MPPDPKGQKIVQGDKPGPSNSADAGIDHGRPLSLIVGDHRISPCTHDTYAQFKLWVVKTLTDGEVDTYCDGNVSITHWDDMAGDRFPHLLNPCECGTFLPIDVEPGPMLSSAIGLMSDLNRLKGVAGDIPSEFIPLVDAMMLMAERSLISNAPLEIR